MDELEGLLKEALKHELNRRKGKGTVNRLDVIKETVHSIYSNPENWTLGATVALLHLDTGETLGVFQEYIHKKTEARKLERLPDEVAAQRVEQVAGREWLGGYVHQVDPPTEGELAHMRAAWRPKMWRPAWKHKRAKVVTASSNVVRLFEKLCDTQIS